MMRRVLFVDDDRAVREALGQTLELAGLRPTLAGSYIEAKDHISTEFEGVVVTDIRMPGKDGFALLDLVQKADPELPVVLLTGEADVPMAVRAMAGGAFDFLEKPCSGKDLLAVVEKALETRARVMEARFSRAAGKRGDAASRILVGDSPVAEGLREAARRAARSGAEVLITGAPGAGNSKLAEVIHLLSTSARRPFVKLAAAGLDVAGLEAGFAQAEGGTLYLDEVADLPQPAQFALIELLETRPATRLIAGTYRDLPGEARAGRFHPDLYWRLEALKVRIPSLSERPEDIPALFRHYVATACEQANLRVPDIPPELTAQLMARDWPGNARALMSEAMRFAMGLDAETEPAAELGLAERMAAVEKSLLAEALARAKGNATEAAAALRLPRKTFYDKLTRHGLRPEDYRG
ncbi:MAG: sigma-54-dependent Fis family transcriptional regulator [Thioclava marina]|jgi:Response regulator containing CheY-like receiver, AAA-type ATPase, and DNA-binding domains|uniref:Sigma-54-dependent Fis family transcriptional regulator n=1 Tax=Thioclava marina TaxID=1915077 RepID=A0ABX3MMK6_9RHOB|nr:MULTISPECIES: sigma-54 dependent transcriptional regulator [Thioclava]MBC7146020.1 sigma-54-dependent Fis family transcriptional regulator [Thioclava marina]OOY12777.1 sigma-54-dependent Fis family transcriptional regulator [Thioclava marina]OOY28002.1 sigma-54-dependent Fis family transcriptional regulator [Thioclava sp. L04-15]TNE82633.1 MAG: sigma-54-dependent Fis family transcriptional regulator [Paracoccaceae bacterium]